MGQLFKTISFPKEKSETDKTEMIRLAFNETTDLELFNALKNLRSSDIRALLPDKTYRQLLQIANDERRSLNQLCLFLLAKKFEDIKKSYGNNISITNVLSKNLVYTNIDRNSATFRDNKINEIHRWYPYIEGFSCTLVEEIIDNLSYKPTFIYDPFSGTGTTQLVASHKNIQSCYSEINPFMSFIIECKVNKVIDVINNNLKKKFEKVNDFINNLQKKFNKLDSAKINYNEYVKRLGTASYFDKETLENLLKIKFLINNYFEDEAILRDLCLFSLSTIIVAVSNTIRRADLRYKRKDEKKYSSGDTFTLFINKVREIISDISSIDKLSLCKTSFVSSDAKNIPQTYDKKFDLVITSPPYVNGTNYFRNTKLELVLLDFVNNIENIALLKKEAITSGINNVVLKGNNNIKIPKLQPIIDKLKECAYDKRIPILIESYFSDMFKVFSNISMHLDNEKYFYFDIGDSQFAGVHIPTDQIIIEIAGKNNFELIDNKFIRERFSKNGMPLKQVLLLFKKSKDAKFFIKNNSICKNSKDLLFKNYEIFKRVLPYKDPPYNSRNWGHTLHNLCSYQGKLKPSLAHFLIKLFSFENMKILDPLCGVGTIPLEACLQGRIGIGNDLSLLAYANTFAKVSKPNRKKMLDELSRLDKFIKKNLVSKGEAEKLQFGYNRNITEYYHPDTLREIITARNYFRRIKHYDCEKALLLSVTLHVLHGNRPYALSRRSHNVTPLAPKGPFVYKSLAEKVSEKIKRTLELERPQNFRNGEAFNEDYKNLNTRIKDNSIDLVITSPPFFDSTRFYMSNWIRMWFCGWDKDDFETKKNEYLETQQVKNMSVYIQFFKICKSLLKKNGVIIMHLGKSDKHDMGKTLSEIAEKELEVFGLFDENVSHCEKFGIKDQGATRAHQFLFLIK